MLRKIRLYGELAKAVGERVLYADVRSAAQTVRFLIANWPELEKYMTIEKEKQSKKLQVVGKKGNVINLNFNSKSYLF